jgi:nitrogen regulatory protein P-II 1
MRFKAVVAMVKEDITDRIVDAAKQAGGTGATIVPARGTGIHEAKTFFGLTLDVQTDVVIFIVEEHLVEPILQAVWEAGEFEKPGTGIAFVVSLDQIIGLESQIEHFEKKAETDLGDS